MVGIPGMGASQADFIKPSAILLNGGVLKWTLLADHLLETINAWLTQANAAPAKLVAGVDLDLAVARGAAYYGVVRQGQGYASVAILLRLTMSGLKVRCLPFRACHRRWKHSALLYLVWKKARARKSRIASLA